MSNPEIKDEWNIALDKQIIIIEKCQEENQLSSCTLCPKIIECEIRKQYVKAVYESMNKGAGGGFEF
ncbi:MAG: hypothetical protein KAQ94_00180 [Arcobacteraceae bacterium]|nr:hypothetical protein [Arcobacteraceae bacterium]